MYIRTHIDNMIHDLLTEHYLVITTFSILKLKAFVKWKKNYTGNYYLILEKDLLIIFTYDLL